MPEPSVSSPAIYQLRVVLCGVSPLVWRRLLVVSGTSLAELHDILQSAFDWSGEHLRRFLIHGVAYGFRSLGLLGTFMSPRRDHQALFSARLCPLHDCVNARCTVLWST